MVHCGIISHLFLVGISPPSTLGWTINSLVFCRQTFAAVAYNKCVLYLCCRITKKNWDKIQTMTKNLAMVNNLAAKASTQITLVPPKYCFQLTSDSFISNHRRPPRIFYEKLISKERSVSWIFITFACSQMWKHWLLEYFITGRGSVKLRLSSHFRKMQ